jgi:hypothetical protein
VRLGIAENHDSDAGEWSGRTRTRGLALQRVNTHTSVRQRRAVGRGGLVQKCRREIWGRLLCCIGINTLAPQRSVKTTGHARLQSSKSVMEAFCKRIELSLDNRQLTIHCPCKTPPVRPGRGVVRWLAGFECSGSRPLGRQSMLKPAHLSNLVAHRLRLARGL